MRSVLGVKSVIGVKAFFYLITAAPMIPSDNFGTRRFQVHCSYELLIREEGLESNYQ
jgi:hypothetical protein